MWFPVPAVISANIHDMQMQRIYIIIIKLFILDKPNHTKLSIKNQNGKWAKEVKVDGSLAANVREHASMNLCIHCLHSTEFHTHTHNRRLQSVSLCKSLKQNMNNTFVWCIQLCVWLWLVTGKRVAFARHRCILTADCHSLSVMSIEMGDVRCTIHQQICFHL